MKQHRPKVPVVGLKTADDGIAASDVDEALAVDVERDRCQRLLPGALSVGLIDAVDVTRDGVPALTHHHGRGVPPAFHWKGHHDRVAKPGPAAEAASLSFKVERSLGNQFETRDRRDGCYSPAGPRLP